ncbi:MAG TPA: DUF2268 domain-containing putative Zn-dependent protease [Gaiellaceae bacterium]|nr:DUF2268 domain-containing putative Zn-dependent protease [Gaiellaceae bacterium]
MTIDGPAREAGDESGVDLEALVRHSVEEVLPRLPHRNRVRINVRVDPASVVPEVGFGGFANPRDGTVTIWLDQPLRKGAEVWVPATVAHELHHSSRIRTGPGYGSTLAEALVTEGLADHFVREVFPATPSQPWTTALSRKQEAQLWREAQSNLEIPGGYDHHAWFLGSSDVPRWTGYTLGYRIVADYLGDERRASAEVKTDARRIIAPYAFANRH